MGRAIKLGISPEGRNADSKSDRGGSRARCGLVVLAPAPPWSAGRGAQPGRGPRLGREPHVLQALPLGAGTCLLPDPLETQWYLAQGARHTGEQDQPADSCDDDWANLS